MAVFAFDIAPYLFVRLAPGVGADLALVGPLPEGADGQLLGHAQLIGGLQQGSYPQLLLDLAAAGDLSADTLRWVASSLIAALAGPVQHVALVLSPPAAGAIGEELRSLASQYAPSLAFACFGEQASAIRWMASRLPGVQSTTTPEEVRADAQAGRWAEAVARYRAMYAAPLSAAVEVVESLLADAVGPVEGPAASLIPSTEQPAGDFLHAPVVLHVPSPEPTGAASDLSPFGATLAEEPDSSHTSTDTSAEAAASADVAAVSAARASGRASVPPSPTRASLTDEASVAVRSSSPGHDAARLSSPGGAEPPAASQRSVDNALFASAESQPEASLLEAHQHGGFDALLRGLMSKRWYVAFDGDQPRLDELDGQLGVYALDDAPMAEGDSAPLALSGSRLAWLLDDHSRQVRFSPNRDDEVTLRHHQLPLARAMLATLETEGHLAAVEGSPERLGACLTHPFQVLLERGEPGDRAALIPGPEGGLVALLFTTPDALVRLLTSRPAALTLRPLGAQVAPGEALIERLLTLPIDGILVNAAGPGAPVLLRRELLASRPRAIPEEPTSPPPPARPFEADVPTAYVTIDPSMLEKARLPHADIPERRASSPEFPDSGTSSTEIPGRLSSPPAHEPPARLSQPSPVSGDSIEAAILASSATVPEAVFAPLPARSLAEASFFLDQRGYSPQDRYQWTEERAGAHYLCFHTRGADGQAQRVDFQIPAAAPTPNDGYFGPGPSPLFGPVELVTIAGSMVRGVPGSPYGLRHEELAMATHRLEMATILVTEALRFYGPHDDAPPVTSLRTDDERQTAGRDPERFRRARVEELGRSYWLLATQLGEALRGTA